MNLAIYLWGCSIHQHFFCYYIFFNESAVTLYINLFFIFCKQCKYWKLAFHSLLYSSSERRKQHKEPISCSAVHRAWRRMSLWQKISALGVLDYSFIWVGGWLGMWASESETSSYKDQASLLYRAALWDRAGKILGLDRQKLKYVGSKNSSHMHFIYVISQLSGV